MKTQSLLTEAAALEQAALTLQNGSLKALFQARILELNYF